MQALRLAGVALALCCVGLAAAGERSATPTVALLALACVFLAAGELWQAAGGWDLSYKYAPEDCRTMCLAVFNLGPTAQEICGPLLITGVVITAGPAGWLGLAVVFLVTAWLAGIVVRRLGRAHAGAA
jgi:dipeptide/tripeptide permease